MNNSKLKTRENASLTHLKCEEQWIKSDVVMAKDKKRILESDETKSIVKGSSVKRSSKWRKSFGQLLTKVSKTSNQQFQ